MTSDQLLIKRAQKGDRQALETLLRNEFDRIYAIARRITGNSADADDATQEALLAITRGLARFDGRSSFKTWVYRVTTNACLDELRRRKRRPLATDDAMLTARTAPARDLSDTVTAELTLDAALGELPVEFRAAVVLRDVCQLDYGEIAEVLGIPPGTVRSRIARGRGHLARALRNQHDESERRSYEP